jgi:uncharacterized membrane protein
MPVVISIHTMATIIWLGGLFFLCVILQKGTRQLDLTTGLSLWHQLLSRFFMWGWIGMILILFSGISMIFLEFGGFSGVPPVHRVNMLIGIPAILLYVYLYFQPWQSFRRAMLKGESNVAESSIRRVRLVMSVILALGIIASVVSLAGRFTYS